MILHFVNDEKFIDNFIANQKEYCPSTINKYFVWSNVDKRLNHIRNQEVKIINKHSFDEIFTYIRKENPTKIIFHNLNKKSLEIIPNIPSRVEIGWIFYGAEIFNRRENINVAIGKKTKSFVNKGYKGLFRPWFYSVQFWWEINGFKIVPQKSPLFIQAIHRINFIAHWIVEDYEFIKKRYSTKKLKFINFCYSNKVAEANSTGIRENMLIGNSGSITNNHLEVISLIPANFISKFNKIIIPLSYSGQPQHLAEVKRRAIEKFGDKVIFLDSFMNKEEYFKVLSSVKLAIMGHYRSQAGANIRFFLKNGIDVMMPQTSNLYKFLHRVGFKTHALESLSDNFKFLSIDDHEINRNAQIAIFEGAMVKKSYTNLLSEEKSS